MPFDKLPPEYAGVALAMFLAALRIVYDGKDARPTRIIVESLICGGLALTASYGIAALGLDSNWVVFSSGVIGYLGSTTVRGAALKIIRKKTD